MSWHSCLAPHTPEQQEFQERTLSVGTLWKMTVLVSLLSLWQDPDRKPLGWWGLFSSQFPGVGVIGDSRQQEIKIASHMTPSVKNKERLMLACPPACAQLDFSIILYSRIPAELLKVTFKAGILALCDSKLRCCCKSLYIPSLFFLRASMARQFRTEDCLRLCI